MRRDDDNRAVWAAGTARRSASAETGFALRLRATLDGVPEARHRLRAWLHVHYLDPDLVADVVLAAGELVGNSVEHGFGPGEPGEVDLTARLDGGLLVLRVADTGSWRPPVPGPSSRGRGLLIVRAVADSVEVEHTGGGTRVTAVFSHPS